MSYVCSVLFNTLVQLDGNAINKQTKARVVEGMGRCSSCQFKCLPGLVSQLYTYYTFACETTTNTNTNTVQSQSRI